MTQLCEITGYKKKNYKHYMVCQGERTKPSSDLEHGESLSLQKLKFAIGFAAFALAKSTMKLSEC